MIEEVITKIKEARNRETDTAVKIGLTQALLIAMDIEQAAISKRMEAAKK